MLMLFPWLSAILTFSLAAPAVQRDSAAGVTAFVDVNVIPMDREQVLHAQTVLVRAGHIIALGPATTTRVPQGATQIDGRGKFLIPGLADMHFHLATVDSARAKEVLFLLVANGVTTIRDVDYMTGVGAWLSKMTGPDLLRWRARAAAGTLVSPRIYTSGPWRAYGSDRPADIARTIAAYQAAGYDFIKIHDEDRVTFDAVAAAARRLKMPFIGHVPDDVSFNDALAAGYTSIEHLYAYLPALVKGDGPLRAADTEAMLESDHGSDADFLAMIRQHLDPSRIPALAAATQRAHVWNCPTQYLAEIMMPDVRFDTLAELRYVPNDQRISLLQAKDTGYRAHNSEVRLVSGRDGTLDLRRQIIRSLQMAGAGLLSGTDGPLGPLVPGFAVHRELAALVQAGLTPYQALATSTRNVAAYFGTLAESGTIAVGKQADLVLLDGNPLTDIHNTTRVRGVMLHGRWLSRTELDQQLAALVRH